MGTREVVGYGIISVLRARRRSAFVLVGLSLAVATLATPAISLDSEVRALVDRNAATIPYDFHAIGRTADFENASSAAASVAGVTGAEPLVMPTQATLRAVTPASNASGSNLTLVDIAFVRPSFGQFSGPFGLTGSFALAAMQVAVTNRLANRLGVGVGDALPLLNFVLVCTVNPPSCHNENRTANYTIGSIISTPLLPSASPYLSLPTGAILRDTIVFAAFDSLSTMRNQLDLAIDIPPRVAILVWADRSRLIDPYDSEATATRVLHLEREIGAAVVPWNLAMGEATSPDLSETLAGVVQRVNDATGGQRVLFLALSLPAASLGYLFSRMGFEVGLARRRREIGILRSRGWSASQIMFQLLVEAAILGATAALIGFVAAVFVSRVFLGLVGASFAGGAPIPFANVSVSLLSVAVTIAGGFAVALLVAYPSVRRLSGIRIVRALNAVHPSETAVAYTEARSFAFIAAGVGGLLLVLGFQAISGEGGFLTFLFGAALAVLLVTAPVVLILGLVGFLTSGTNRPYRALALLVRRWTGEMHFLVAEGLRRSPKRSATLVTIVAFCSAFALFVVSLLGMVEASEVRSARTAVGGDLTVDAADVARSTMEAVRSEPGVAAIAVADFVPSSLGVLVAIDGPAYAETVPWLDSYYFLEGGPAAVGSLSSRDGAVVNREMASALRLHMDDPLVVGIRSGQTPYAVVLRIAAVVIALPGLQPSGQATDPTPTIFADVRTLAAQNVSVFPNVEPGRRAILRLTSGTDPHGFANALGDRWTGHAAVLEDVLDAIRSDPFRASLFGHLYTQAGLAVLVMILAVTLTTFGSGIEREDEFATILARGLNRRGLTAVLFGEGLAVGILGAILAVPVVLVFLWVVLRLFPAARPSLLPIEFGVPLSAWILLTAAVAAVAFGSLLAGIRLARMDLPRVLSLRGL